MHDFFCCIVEDSYAFAKQLSNESMPNLNNENLSRITSWIINVLYKTVSIKEDIFYFLSNCFININVFHILLNSNKRLAIAILIKLLYNFGYYFKFTNDIWKEAREWENKSIDIIKQYSNNNNNVEQIIMNVRKWIMDNILIAIHFV